MQQVSCVMVLSLGALGAALGGCSKSDGNGQSTEAADTTSAALRVACEIHYYNAGGLPEPRILNVAQTEGPVDDATDLSMMTPEGITTVIARSSGKLIVEVLAAGGTFLASGAYTVPSTKALSTDLQAPLTPTLTRDGVTYDRLWVGCARSTGTGSTDAGQIDPPPVSGDAASLPTPDVAVVAPGGSCQFNVSRCEVGYACTYVYGATAGTCIKPGTEGGLCGGTYADFAGGDCDPGLQCDLATAPFPGGGAEATYFPSLTGECHAGSTAVDAGAGD